MDKSLTDTVIASSSSLMQKGSPSSCRGFELPFCASHSPNHMDDCFGKRNTEGSPSFTRQSKTSTYKGSNSADKAPSRYCNRLGCAASLNCMRGADIPKAERSKISKAPFHPISSRAVFADCSSGSSFSPKESRKSQPGRHETLLSSRKTTKDSRSTTSSQKALEESASTSSSFYSRTSLSDYHDLKPSQSSSTVSSRATSSSRPVHTFNRHSTTSGTCHASSSSSSSFSRSIGRSVKSISSSKNTTTCHNNRTEAARKRPAAPECSRNRSAALQFSGTNMRNSSSYVSSPSSQHRLVMTGSMANMRVTVSTRSRNNSPCRGESRLRLSEQDVDHLLLLPDSTDIPLHRSSRFSIEPEHITETTSARLSDAELHLDRGSNSRATHNRLMTTNLESSNSSRNTHGAIDGARLYMEGIAEMLLALERIEHDEGFAHEQLLVFDTSLLMENLGIHDRHRDMRMDIDNMTYEELLALEDKMGSVSTALTEEALSKCLRRSIFLPNSPAYDANAIGEDDTKCSICQEEYLKGEDIGKLVCQHRYHEACIHQWLQRKNWCPICKAAAETST